VANAGLAVGKEPVGEANEDDWEQMMNANCMGAFRLINLILPEMIKRGGGHVVATGSIAGLESYEGGSVYCASKHALHAFMKSLRYETHAKNVRVTTLAPGMVGEGTEFSEVRFKGDSSKAAATYVGMQELRSSDCAAQILWALRQPPHVNIDFLHVQPTSQGSAQRIHRNA
jgi:3-hydroxy acid dehydrogenase/malonic semialdehyde reductase